MAYFLKEVKCSDTCVFQNIKKVGCVASKKQGIYLRCVCDHFSAYIQ